MKVKINNLNLNEWKKKLKNLPYSGFIVIPEIGNTSDSHIESGNEEIFSGFHADKDLLHRMESKGLIFRSYLLGTYAQWIAGLWKPSQYADEEYPPVVVADFYTGNRAEVKMKHPQSHANEVPDGYGFIWSKEEVEMTGTWEDVYNHLVNLINKALQLFDIPDTVGLMEVNQDIDSIIDTTKRDIKEWEKKLREITKYHSIFIPEEDVPWEEDLWDTKSPFEPFIYCSYPNGYLLDEGIAILFQTLASTDQWFSKSASAGADIEDYLPSMLVAKFYFNGKASFHLENCYNGSIWTEEELKGRLNEGVDESDEVKAYFGTWKQVYNHLVELVNLVGEKLKLKIYSEKIK